MDAPRPRLRTCAPPPRWRSPIAAAVSPQSALIAIWRFDNATQRFAGYSPIPGAPNDLVTLNRADAIFICVNAPATFTRPAI